MPIGPADHLVASLPGWPPGTPLPSPMYSGHVDISAAMGRPMLTHYLYIESEGEADRDPTILWTNGGPGASSMFGVFVELGPLLLNADSRKTAGFNATGVPTLFYNAYSWSKLGSLLMFDWPPPVGFSYCSDPAGNGTSCGDWDDERMAKASYASLAAWYRLFAHRRGNDLYLTGESYAGIYVPKLAQMILRDADPAVLPQLKGFAVGDGCLGSATGVCGGGSGPWWDVLFLYGHAQMSTALYERVVSSCGMAYLKHGGTPSAACTASLARIKEEVGGYYGYNLYDDCTYDNGLRRRLARLTPPHAQGAAGLVRGALNDYVCGGGSSQRLWVDQPSVRLALHVPLHSNFFDADNGEGMVYRSTEKNLMPFYQHVAKATPLRVLVYNGDTDPSINSFEAQNWTSSLGFTPTQTWRPWTLDGCRRVGGYVTRYGNDRFDFLTIRGSGHMVPQFKPAQAFEFLQRWLKNEDFKPYVASCTKP